MPEQRPTPAAAGFAMPAEWGPHAACVMVWPARRELWADRWDDAKADYAGVARAVAAFEPVLMVCNPGTAAEVVDRCGSGVTPLELPVDDSWARDSGPVFVTDGRGGLRVVKFGFNAWGERFHPHDQDGLLPDRLAQHFGVDLHRAPMVLEGGSFFVDGEGTLITTEECLLQPNRNPLLSRAQIEDCLRDYLGVTTVVWLPFGHSLDTGPHGTDGHVDGVAQYVSPGEVLLELPTSPDSTELARAGANLDALRAATDAVGRSIVVRSLDPHPGAGVSYVNHYLANGAVIVATDGDPDHDDGALATLKEVYPDREVVGVPALTIAFGGGGPHCITQQVPWTPIGVE